MEIKRIYKKISITTNQNKDKTSAALVTTKVTIADHNNYNTNENNKYDTKGSVLQ